MKIRLKHIFMTLVVFSLLIVASGCEEKDADLLFSVEKVSEGGNVELEYSSPDPMHCPKQYRIFANRLRSELTIRCKNEKAIFIKDNDGNTIEEYTCSNGQWNVKQVNSNTLTFTFNEIDEDSLDESYSAWEGINIISNSKKGELKTYIQIVRLTKSTDPIYL